MYHHELPSKSDITTTPTIEFFDDFRSESISGKDYSMEHFHKKRDIQNTSFYPKNNFYNIDHTEFHDFILSISGICLALTPNGGIPFLKFYTRPYSEHEH